MDFRDAPTQWNLIDELRQSGDAGALAWNRFYFTYSEPIITYVRRRLPQKLGRPVTAGEAEEIAQTFISDCFSRRWLDQADPTKGSFRSLFVTILDRYLARHARTTTRQRHIGTAQVQSLASGSDDEQTTHPDDLRVDDSVRVHFEREWIRVQLAQAMSQLRDRHPALHQVLQDTLNGSGDAEIADHRGISRANVRARRKRARDALRDYYSEIAASTAANATEFDEELLYLEELLDGAAEDPLAE